MWKLRLEDEREAGFREWLGKVTFCVYISKVRVLANRGSNELQKKVVIREVSEHEKSVCLQI